MCRRTFASMCRHHLRVCLLLLQLAALLLLQYDHHLHGFPCCLGCQRLARYSFRSLGPGCGSLEMRLRATRYTIVRLCATRYTIGRCGPARLGGPLRISPSDGRGSGAGLHSRGTGGKSLHDSPAQTSVSRQHCICSSISICLVSSGSCLASVQLYARSQTSAFTRSTLEDAATTATPIN